MNYYESFITNVLLKFEAYFKTNELVNYDKINSSDNIYLPM